MVNIVYKKVLPLGVPTLDWMTQVESREIRYNDITKIVYTTH